MSKTLGKPIGVPAPMMKIQKHWGVEEELPEGIIEKILLKLPVKELIKCSAVCKPWNSLIKSPGFIQTHLKNQRDDDDSELLLLLSSYQSDDLHRDNPAALFGQYSNLPNPIHNHNKSNPTYHLSYHVVGTCNGLVCLCVYSLYGAPSPVILWNPSIRKFRYLPRPGPSTATHLCDSYDFCYDSRINDYKVVRIVKESYLDSTVEVEVWSLARGGAWKNLNNNVPVGSSLDTYHHAFVKGAFHWVQGHEINQEEEEFIVSIVALDMVDESFRNLEIRQARRECPPRISQYHGDGDECWLALFEFLSRSSFNLWVMKEYGVAESWTKLFNVCLLGSPEERPCIQPFGFTKSGQVVVRLGDETLKSYDPKDKQFKDFGNRGYVYYFMDSFVESLVLLDQTNHHWLAGYVIITAGGISKKKKSQSPIHPDAAASLGSSGVTQPTTLVSHGAPDLRDNYDEQEELLRQFDLNMSYGPCLGITRLARWDRACRLGMNPPKEVKSLLKGGKARPDCLWDGLMELLS